MRRFDNDHSAIDHLDQPFSAPWIHFFFHGDGLAHDGIFIVTEFFKRRQDDIIFAGDESLCFLSSGIACRAADPDQIFSIAETVKDFRDGFFAHSVDKDIGFGIDEDGRAHFILPVIVMSQAAHTSTDAAEDRGDAGESGFAQLDIDGFGMWWSHSGFTGRGVHIFVPQSSSCGINTNHGIHIAAGDSASDFGASEEFQRVRIFPIRLSDHADPESVMFQQSADDSRAERRVIHIGIAGDKQDINGIPFTRLHFFFCHGEKFGKIHNYTIQKKVRF